MIYLTGDRHGIFKDIIEKANMFEKEDILIFLGDAGVNYHANMQDVRLKRKLAQLSFTMLFVRGNHEIHPAKIAKYCLVPFGGGLAYVEPEFPNLIFLIDGEIYNIEEKTFGVLGGAYSVDKNYRLTIGAKWFPDEQPNDKDKEHLDFNLSMCSNNKIDFMLTHTCPFDYRPVECFLSSVGQDTVDTSTERYLQTIYNNNEIGRWFCGHYHTNKIVGNVVFLFDRIMPLDLK